MKIGKNYKEKKMKMKFKAYTKAEMESCIKRLEQMDFLQDLDAEPRTLPVEVAKQKAIIEFLNESGIICTSFNEYMNLYERLARFNTKMKAYVLYNYYLRKQEAGEYEEYKHKDLMPYILWYGNLDEGEIISLKTELEDIMINEAGITEEIIEEFSVPLSSLMVDISVARKVN